MRLRMSISELEWMSSALCLEAMTREELSMRSWPMTSSQNRW